MKKNLLIIISLLLFLAVIYFIDSTVDNDNVDCVDNKVNHVLIFFGAIIILAIVLMYFFIFRKFDNDKIEKE